ncbi:ABC transporter ATP-binding protein [Actinoalloteichus sp. AHMU CJ021]|uniref:ABC transporter ATP-binding protein n=1 Tax=Actinoalloteichus TaxID=65496 RepID=UPI0004AA650F|nr:ABC transporter ATP-binding protein [Actinoalloteichus caeruleus]AUS78286.1 ABC transporter ATP-binding protein [Actinoalloteichus sp. AHMU CJ021]
MGNAVEVVDLVKQYRRRPTRAVDGLGFTVEHGEVFGLLGPNGAGKTTTVGVLTTRVLPTSGRAEVEGVDVVRSPERARQLFAVVPQRINLDRSLNVRQNLLFHATYHGVPRARRNRLADELLERMGLADHRRGLVDKLSGGQSQRLMIARALMHEPRVMFLDEPSTGLDPQARLFVHDRVLSLRGQGVTVVLTTHDMAEAAKLCDRVGIVDHGRLLALDTPAGLTSSLPGSNTLTLVVEPGRADPRGLVDAVSRVPSVLRVEHVDRARDEAGDAAGLGDAPESPGREAPESGPGEGIAPAAPGRAGDRTCALRVYLDANPTGVLPTVLGAVAATGGTVSDVSIGRGTLEDVFIQLTGRELR